MAENSDTKQKAKPGYVLDEQIGYLLRLANQRHTAIFQQEIEKRLTPTQFSAMIRLKQHGPVSQNHLGRLAAMDVATIKGVVDRLRAKDLVTLSPDLKDRRRMLVELTQKGLDLYEEVKPIGQKISDRTLKSLSDSERRSLVKLLNKIT